MDFYYPENNEKIEDTLQELCVAEYVQNYCTSCTSGGGCCTEVNSTIYDSDSQDDEELLSEEPDAQKVRRTTLTIDLSKDKDLTDGEILKRLLSPLGNSPSDEPLEVILEIAGEEDEEGNQDIRSKTFQTLRDKLNSIQRHSHLKDSNADISNKHNVPQQSKFFDYKMKNNHQDISSLKSYPCLENKNYYSHHAPPSYKKANALIGEIENCFMETANLVEKTLGAVKPQKRQESTIHINENPKAPSPDMDIPINKYEDEKRKQLSESVEEALQIFDSIIYGNKYQQDYFANQTDSEKKIILNHDTTKFDDTSNSYYSTNYLDSAPFDDSDNNTKTFQDEYFPTNYYSQDYNHSEEQNYMFLKTHSRFEKDVDELFKECYELSSVEPSTTLGSCLKNLESLCSQLKMAKQNILQEIDDSRTSSIRNSLNFEEIDEQFLTPCFVDQHRFSFINELIERKLRNKIKLEKFNLDPPMMGLEGKTHKMIAEVTPKKNILENYNKENRLSFPIFKVNYINKDGDINEGSTYEDSLDESNSEMSIATNTLDSNSFVSSQMECVPQSSNENRNYENFDDYFILGETNKTTTMSHDETLALYEDNQELQQSLLSILHNLNDIHDNFLNRRRVETELSQQSSHLIQNSLKATISSAAEKSSAANLSTFLNEDYATTNIRFPSNIFRYSRNDTKINSDTITEDFEPIQKITRVSDELKNLWSYETKNRKQKLKKPSRSVSFNRSYKPRILNRSTTGDKSNTLYQMNEKCYSLPNLSVDLESEELGHYYPSQKEILSPENSKLSPSNDGFKSSQQANFFAENFVKQVKNENEKCYQVTLNFLQRIMEARKILENNGDERRNALCERIPNVQSFKMQNFGNFYPQNFQEMGHEEDGNAKHGQSEHQAYNAYLRTY